jgi:hypothetical protein
MSKHILFLSDIPPRVGTNCNEGLHKQLNAYLYGTRVVSLEVLLARLTTFFYNYNQKRRGGAEESWKTKTHSLHSVPFTEYRQLDGVHSMAELAEVVQAPTSSPSSSAVEDHQDMLICAMSNIHSRSILFRPLEILLHCKFSGFSLPLPLSEENQDISQFLSDMSLEEEPEKLPFLDAVTQQSTYISGLDDNTAFDNFYKNSFAHDASQARAIHTAILIELEQHPEQYMRFYTFDSSFNESVREKQLNYASTSGINSACAAIATVIKSVVIYVCSSSPQRFHVVIPVLQSDTECLLNKFPLFLIPSFDKGQLLFSCTRFKEHTVAESGSTMDPDTYSNLTNKCACGKGRKTTTPSCISSRCPCIKSSLPCTEQCNCQLCNNENGRKFHLSQKVKGCRCGENHKTEDSLYCVTSLCSCRKFGFSCNDDPACSCKHCKNPGGSKTDLECPPKKRQATERLVLLQKSAGKLPDMNSEQFFKNTGQQIRQSIWNDRENLLLISLMSLVQITKHHISTQTVANLYNTYAEQVREIRKKSLHQVLYKMRHLNDNRSVCNF